MDSSLHENVVLYDWLSFTSKYHTPKELIEALGLSDCPWTDIPGAHGYKDRKYFGHISIHYNGREDMGIWCEMSGQGCRIFEDLSTLPDKWDDLFKFIFDNNLHMTRLDIAFDDHTGILDIERIAEDTKSLSANKQLWYNSHQRRWKKWRKRATSHGQYQMRSGRL